MVQRCANGVYVFNDESIDVIKMNSVVKSRFDSIEVMVRMLGEPHPVNRFFTPPSCHIDGSKDDTFIALALNGGCRYASFVPLFLWGKDCGDYFTYFALHCEEDYVMKYPIRKINVEKHNGRYMYSEEVIVTEEELIEELDGILDGL